MQLLAIASFLGQYHCGDNRHTVMVESEVFLTRWEAQFARPGYHLFWGWSEEPQLQKCWWKLSRDHLHGACLLWCRPFTQVYNQTATLQSRGEYSRLIPKETALKAQTKSFNIIVPEPGSKPKFVSFQSLCSFTSPCRLWSRCWQTIARGQIWSTSCCCK